MNELLNERIKDARLTPRERLVADYITDNIQDACYISASELARQLDISFSTVIRFTKTVGFDGYVNFQKYLREEFKKSVRPIAEEEIVPSKRIALIPQMESYEEIGEAVRASSQRNINTLIMNNSDESIHRACLALIQAENKYLLGSRASDTLAQYFSIMLGRMLPHVITTSAAGRNEFDILADATVRDCVLAIGFPRYSRITLSALEMAKKLGATIICITDKATSPLASFADHLFIVPVNSIHFVKSYFAGYMLAELFASHLLYILGDGFKNKIELIDEFMNPIGNY